MNEIDTVQNNLPAASPTTNNFTAAPCGSAVQNNYGKIINGIDTEIFKQYFGEISERMGRLENALQPLAGPTTPSEPSHVIEWASLSHERYCLFVLENETYKTGSFSIPIRKALKYTDDFTRDNLIGPRKSIFKNSTKNRRFQQAVEHDAG